MDRLRHDDLHRRRSDRADVRRSREAVDCGCAVTRSLGLAAKPPSNRETARLRNLGERPPLLSLCGDRCPQRSRCRGGQRHPQSIALRLRDRLREIRGREGERRRAVLRASRQRRAHPRRGHRVAPPDAPGASAIVESLAKYCELLVLEKKYGRDVVRQSLAYELDLYLAGRVAPGPLPSSSEVPLSRCADEPYLYYRKGSIVMYALRDLLGETTFHRALRNFANEQGGAGHQPHFADLVRHIQAVAPPQHHRLIDQWLNDIVLYDIRLTSTSVKPIGNRYEITMTVDTNLRFDESIEIGLFARDETPIVVAHQPLHRGRNTVVMIADKKPDLAIADPYFTRVDVNRFDNQKTLYP